jgi:hypothetical protein
MGKTMGRFSRALAVAIAGVLLLSSGPTAEAQRERIVIVRPAPFWGWGPGPYWYPYGPYYGFRSDYISANYGYVKIDTHHRDKDASVFVDDGYASKVKNAGKLALRPGNHNIELRDSDGRTIFQERVAVMVGRTTKVDVPS